MITFIWITIILTIVGILTLTAFLREENRFIAPILFLSILSIILSMALRVEYSKKVSHSIDEAYNMGYKDGQVQCIIGNIEYELRTNEDLTVSWEKIKN